MTEPSATVFSWYMPEVADEIEWLLMQSYPTDALLHNYSPGLDHYHDGLMDKARSKILPEVFDYKGIDRLKDYHPYYTNGSSEALFHLLARHKTHHPGVCLYQFEGEYQGYAQYAAALGLQFHTVPFGTDVTNLPPGVFFLSVPSAVDGNIVNLSVVEAICEQHYVILDVAYAGMADNQPLLTINNRVAAVVGSMSKPFGLYYYRIGFLWSRDPVNSLYGNKWFKNVWSITVGESVLAQYSASQLAETYRPWQARACAEASDHLGVRIKPSDVWLLGHVYPNSEDGIPASMSAFKRGLVYRVCLTPYYMSYVQREDGSTS